MRSLPAALTYLNGLTALGIRPGLEGIRAALERLEHPEDATRLLRVGGTNGKGATAALLATSLAASGHRVGLFTSPHLIDVRERIRIDGRIVPARAFVRALDQVRSAIERSPAIPLTYFEVIAATAFVAFREAAVDVAVLEAGLGGRWDATNVGHAPLTLLTNVEMDHMKHLGRSRAAIAEEKVRLASDGSVLVSGVSSGPAAEVVARYAHRHRIHVVQPPRTRGSGEGFRHRGPGLCVEVRRLGLGGGFQHRNAALVLAALEELAARGLDVDSAGVGDALERTRWPGRLQRIDEQPAVLVDGAHNPHAARALAEVLPTVLPARPRVLLVTQLSRKSPRAFLKALAPVADRLVATELHDHECVPAARLAEEARALGLEAEALPDPEAALTRARRRAGRGGSVCATGSLFLVGRLLRPEDVRDLLVDIAPARAESKDPRGARGGARAHRRRT